MANTEMKNCKYCTSEIPKDAKICPKCQKDLRNWFVRHPIWSFFLVIIILGAIFGEGDIEKNKVDKKIFTQEEKIEKKQEIKKENIDKKLEKKDYGSKEIGKYKNYKYTINKEDKINIAMFEPFLEKNDKVVFGAIKKVANDFYKNEKFENINPKVETLDTGKNAVVLETTNNKYYFLIFKDETGKVFGFSFWEKVKDTNKKEEKKIVKKAEKNGENEINIIKNNCNKKWGDDFRMIKYCINQQKKAREKFNKGNISGIKEDVFLKIRNGCIKKWGYDFQMRMYCEGQQIKSYQDLQKM